MMKRIVWGIVVVWLVLPGICTAFDVTARVDKTRMTMEDILSFQVEVDGGKAGVDMGAVTDFRVVSSGTSTQQSLINGNWEHKVIYQYRLVPLKKGNLTIPSLAVTRGKQVQKTSPIRIQVTDRPVDQGSSRPLFARAEVSRTDPVAGQQILYAMKLYVGQRIAGASLDAPGFDGFTAKEIEERKKYTRTINGITYSVTEVRYILTPVAAGDFTIEPAVVTANVVVQSRSTDPFDSFFNNAIFSGGRTKPVRIVANSVDIKVSPLPPYAGDPPFSGLVGKFGLDARMDKTKLPAGESATLTLTIQGTGNIMDAGEPDLALPGDRFKVYADTPTEEIRISDGGYTGKKVFKRALVPVVPGDVMVPGVRLAYFDVEKKAYITLATPEISLSVTPSQQPQAPGAEPVPSPGTRKQEVVIKEKDILDIRQDVAVLTHVTRIRFPVFLMLVFLPGVLLACAALAARVGKKEKTAGRLMAEKAKYHLGRANETDVTDPAFSGHVHASLMAAVNARANRTGEGLTREETIRLLTDAGTENKVIDRVVALLDEMEAVRFGGRPVDPETGRGFLDQLKGLIRTLAVVVLAASLFLGNPETGRAADNTSRFINAVNQYEAGAFEAAANSFETIAESGVRNPGLFYNIGNSYLKAGDTGRAILWYERAKRMAPRDPDLMFNLEHARSLVKDKVEKRISLWDVFFFWHGLVPLKWMQLAAVVFSCLFALFAGIQLFRGRPFFRGIGSFLAGVTILLTVAASLQYYRESNLSQAVIVRETVAVKSGTSPAATRLFELHAGTKVRVRETARGYLKIMLTPDKVGWVKQGEAIPI